MAQTGPILLDSSDPAGVGAEWACAPCEPIALLSCDSSGKAKLTDHRGVVQQWDTPLPALEWMADHLRSVPREMKSRWIGYLSYDLGRWFERLPTRAGDDLGLPLFVFTFHHRSSIHFDDYPCGRFALTGGEVRSNFTRQQYLDAVGRAIDYIAAGDVFQVNLSQRFTAPLREQPREIYRRLRELAPAVYGAYLEYEDHALICNSPELFLRVMPDRRVITRPIKGTQPRSPGRDIELRDSIKDQAELNMIVDLERNDLGRVCEIGSVKVSQARVVEAHPTVYHGVATVEGRLREDVTFVDLLRATFPGGSVTGAPKIRAMEIIEELENVRRGPYCGAIGYLSADGTMEFNVAIRTMIVKDGLVHIPVGGGIVADSVPAAEYDETLVKAQATFAALGLRPQEANCT